MALPALPALSSLTGGGALTPSSSAGPADSGVGHINVGGLDFGGGRDRLATLALSLGLVVSSLTILRWLK